MPVTELSSLGTKPQIDLHALEAAQAACTVSILSYTAARILAVL